MPLRRTRDLKCNGCVAAGPTEAPYGTATDAGADGPDACFQHNTRIKRGGNQANSESCVWWSYAGGLWMLLGILGLPPAWLSVLGGYYLTRMRKLVALGSGRSELWDGGCRTVDAAAVLREVGWMPDEAWPFNAFEKDTEPPMDALLKAPSRDWLRPRRVLAYGPDHAKIIRQTLSPTGKAARPIMRATRVNQPYLDWQPGDPPWRFSGAAKGRHMELCGNYDQRGLHRVSSWLDRFDRIESWDSVENDDDAETWVLDVDVAALAKFIKQIKGRAR